MESVPIHLLVDFVMAVVLAVIAAKYVIQKLRPSSAVVSHGKGKKLYSKNLVVEIVQIEKAGTRVVVNHRINKIDKPGEFINPPYQLEIIITPDRTRIFRLGTARGMLLVTNIGGDKVRVDLVPYSD